MRVCPLFGYGDFDVEDHEINWFRGIGLHWNDSAGEGSFC